MLSFIIKLLNKYIKHRAMLRQFYIEIYTWIIDGCPQHRVFRTDMALCSNLSKWLWHEKDAVHVKVHMLLISQFVRGGLNPAYPFNQDNDWYCRELCAHAFYKNPKRVQWVHDHALQSLW